MPDSFSPPPWGPPSFDERDLDSLLAGKTDVPDALRPVADTLSALRTAPSPRELRGEAFIRAQFHSPRPASPARHAAPRRPTRRRPRGWLAGMVAAAAVIVLVAAITYTGHLPGPVQRIAHDAIAAPSAKQHTSAGASPGVQARSATPVPSASQHPVIGNAPASAPPGAPNRVALCDRFWAAMEHPPANRKPWQIPLYNTLSDAAGGPRRIFSYCFPVWNQKDARQYPLLPSFPPYFPKQWNSARPGDSSDQQGGEGPANSGPGNNAGPAKGPGNSNSGSTGPGPQTPSAAPAANTGAQQGSGQ